MRIIKKIRENKIHINNSMWMLSEHIGRMLYGLLIGVLIARHLGPNDFGVFSFITAIVLIFYAISRLGLDGILVREYLIDELNIKKNVATAFFGMQLVGLGITVLIVIAVAILFRDGMTSLYYFLGCAAIFFQGGIAIDCYFQAKLNYSKVAKIKLFSMILLTIASILGIYYSLELWFFLLAAFSEKFVVWCFLYLLYKLEIKEGKPVCFSVEYFFGFLSKSTPLLVTAISVTLYSKIDQVMIGYILGKEQLGVYSAAVKFYDAWVAVPYLLTQSILPLLLGQSKLDKNKFENSVVLVLRSMFWFGVILAIFIALFGELVIKYSFGVDYIESHMSLVTLMLASSFVGLGTGGVRYMVVVGLEKYIAFRTIAIALLNIALNFVLIPIFGIWGASLATLFAVVFGSYIFDYFYDDLKVLRRLKTKAMFFI